MKCIKIKNKELLFVPPGKLVVSKDLKHILCASLGSCVGLGLIDKKSGVGGIAHLLLHITQIVGEGEYIFSENAVDILLQKMELIGAKKESIIAGIAGGIALDTPWVNGVGSRTVETIKEQLAKNNIEIGLLEPIDSLNKAFCVDIENKLISCMDPYWEVIKWEENREEPDEITLKEAVEKIKPLPQIVVKILSQLGQPYYNISEIVEEIKKDEVIVAKLIKYCNSPVFSPVREIDSVEKAVIFLGSRKLLEVILTVYLDGFYGRCAYELQEAGMYTHSLAVAMLSQMLCEYLDLPSDVGFTCGLLHDIGKKVLDELVKNRKKEYYKEVLKGRESVDVEMEMFQRDHSYLGAYLAKKWNFPNIILEVIKTHHRPGDESEKIVKVVYIANIMAHYLLPGLVICGSPSNLFEKVMKSLGLGYDDLMKIIEKFPITMFYNEKI